MLENLRSIFYKIDLSEKDDEKIVFHIYILNSWARKSQRQKLSASCKLTVTFAFNIPLLSDRALFLIGVLYQIFSHLDSNIIDVYISPVVAACDEMSDKR